MDIQQAIRVTMASAGVTGRQLSGVIANTPQSASNKISRGLTNIADLIKLAEACKATVNIKLQDGTELQLTHEQASTDI